MQNNRYNCPCTRDCPDRVPGCHGTCPKYKAWTERCDVEKKARTAYNERFALTAHSEKAVRKSCLRHNSYGHKDFS